MPLPFESDESRDRDESSDRDRFPARRDDRPPKATNFTSLVAFAPFCPFE